MKRLLTILIASAMFLLIPIAVVHAVTIHTPTELIYYDTTKAYQGVTVFTPLNWAANPSTTTTPSYTVMLDMTGRLVNKWTYNGTAGGVNIGGTTTFAEFLETGHLLKSITPANNVSLDPYSLLFAFGGFVEEVDWSNNHVFTYNTFTTDPYGVVFRQTHDFHRIFNKKLGQYTTLFVTGQIMTQAFGNALGANNPSSANGWSCNAVYEMDMSGNIIWIWSFADHTCSTSTVTSPRGLHYTAGTPQLGRLDINLSNTQNAGPVSDWNHINSIGYNSDLGYIVINSRNHNEFYVIDHQGTFAVNTDGSANLAQSVTNAASTAGDFKYRFGAPMNYLDPTGSLNTGDRPSWGNNGTVQIWGAHNIQYIDDFAYTGGPALPGAGHFLIWDNHSTNNNPLGGTSQIKEINPYISGKTGTTVTLSPNYVFQYLAGYALTSNGSASIGWALVNTSNQVVWSYSPNNPGCENSTHISGAQRLPNGDSIGISGETGSIYEVTNSPPSHGTLVWEYVNPISNGVAARYVQDPTTSSVNQIFRAYRWDVNHPGLVNNVKLYPNGQILPKVLGMPGVGYTLTGAAPCLNTPCNSGTSVGGF